MNRPTPISVFSDQRRTKSITWYRLSCGAQLPVKVPQDFFLARCAPPSTRPGPRPWSAPSSPRTQSVSASPPPDGGDAPEPERRPLRSRRTPSASGRTPSAASPVPHTGPRPEPCPEGGASEWPPSPLRCNAFVPFSYVRSAILTDERFLHFQLRQDTPKSIRTRVLQYDMIGTGRLRTALQRQGVDPTQRAQRSALISLAGRLIGLAANLERTTPQPSDDDAIRLRALSERLGAIRTEPGRADRRCRASQSQHAHDLGARKAESTRTRFG